MSGFDGCRPGDGSFEATIDFNELAATGLAAWFPPPRFLNLAALTEDGIARLLVAREADGDARTNTAVAQVSIDLLELQDLSAIARDLVDRLSAKGDLEGLASATTTDGVTIPVHAFWGVADGMLSVIWLGPQPSVDDVLATVDAMTRPVVPDQGRQAASEQPDARRDGLAGSKAAPMEIHLGPATGPAPCGASLERNGAHTAGPPAVATCLTCFRAALDLSEDAIARLR